jgi:hypothetical protein
MKSLDNIAEDLFNKIRGRFPSVTIGDKDGKITNDPLTARFFDFDYKEGGRNIGKVSISVSEDKLSVMYSNSFVENEDTLTRQNWYNFLKELRTFAKKRLLQFDTRDITKSNLNKRDYEFLAQQGGDRQMSESKLYGTSKVSYQDVGAARLNIRHTQAVNPELAASRTQHIDKIYIESADGERFMYPYRHLAGARAMARHVSEGGKPFDDFGKHITGLSEEVSKLRKFKTYMGRSAVMAEGLSGYLDAVVERIDSIKTELNHIQRPTTYKETFDNFEVPVMEDVPEDVAENWIDQLTIRQFNEELKDIFPYVYRLVSEHTRAQVLSHMDLLDEEAEDVDPLKEALQNACESGDDEACEHFENLDLYVRENAQAMLDKLSEKYVDSKEEEEDEFEASLDDILGQFGRPKAEPQKPEVPLSEFILSLYDRETGEWPKGETAVLTAVEKDYGEHFIDPAKQFIERVKETYDQFQMEANPQQLKKKYEMDPEDEVGMGDDDLKGKVGMDDDDEEKDESFDRMRELAGLR